MPSTSYSVSNSLLRVASFVQALVSSIPVILSSLSFYYVIDTPNHDPMRIALSIYFFVPFIVMPGAIMIIALKQCSKSRDEVHTFLLELCKSIFAGIGFGWMCVITGGFYSELAPFAVIVGSLFLPSLAYSFYRWQMAIGHEQRLLDAKHRGNDRRLGRNSAIMEDVERHLEGATANLEMARNEERSELTPLLGEGSA